MRKILHYTIESVFPSRKVLEEDYIKNKKPIKGKHLLYAKATERYQFTSFYDPERKEKPIELDLNGKTLEDLVEAGVEFLSFFHKKYE